MNNKPHQSGKLGRETFLLRLRRILDEPRSLSQLRRAINLMFVAFAERDRLAPEALESERKRKRAARWDDPKEAALRLLGHGGPDLEDLDEADGATTSALERIFDPSKHPRGGFVQNRGWFSRTWGGGASSGPARQTKTQSPPQQDLQAKPKFRLVSDTTTNKATPSLKDRNRQMTDLTGDPAFAARNRLIDEIHDLFTFPSEIAHAAVGGLLTGAKAVVNGAATAVRSVATLGLNTAELELIGVTKEDRANGYNTAVAIATASGQVLIAVGTGGLASALAKGGTVARTASGALVVFDAAGNAVGVVQGVADAKANGFNLRNGMQIAGSALGLGANGAALSKIKQVAADAPKTKLNPQNPVPNPVQQQQARPRTWAAQPNAYWQYGKRFFPTRANSGLSGEALRLEQKEFFKRGLQAGKLPAELRGQAVQAGYKREGGWFHSNDRLVDKGAEKALQDAIKETSGH